MRAIVAVSLRWRWLVVAVAAVVMLYSLDTVADMPIDVFPEVGPPLVEVQTEALGLSATEVESLITVPMEADLLNGVAWLDRIYSESVSGLSSIHLIFEEGTDPIAARQMVAERLTQAFALPNVSKPPTMLQPLSSSNRVMMIGLSSQEASLIDMSVLARWNIRPRLMGVPGVANVAIWGERQRQLQVQVDPVQLSSAGVTLAQVIETAGNALWVSPLNFLNASTPGTAGWIDTPNQRLGLHHILPIRGPDELARVSVAGSQGLLLKDVARVVEDHQPLIGDAAVRDGAGLLLVLEKFPGANTVEVTEGVEEAMAVLRSGMAGIEMETVFRPANYIELATDKLVQAALLGAVFMALVLFAFLEGWRPVVISLVVIPLSLAVAGLVLYAFGLTMNVLTAAGLTVAIGAVAYDAVFDVENVVRRLRQRQQTGSGQTSVSTIAAAALEMRRPAVLATLIMLLAVLPAFFWRGEAAAFIWPLGMAYVLALLASAAVAFFVTPALSLILWRQGVWLPRVSPLIHWLRQRYRSGLSRLIGIRCQVSGAAVAVGIAGLAMLPLLHWSLLPSLQQTDLVVTWQAAPGTSRTEMNRVLTAASGELSSVPGVARASFHVGRAITGDQVVGTNSGVLWLSLDGKADFDATVEKVREVISGYPGFTSEVQTYQPKRDGERLSVGDRDLVARVYGHDWDVLQVVAKDVQQRLAHVNGITAAYVEVGDNEPQVEIEVDLAQALRYQVKPGDVRRQAAALLSGLQVGNLFEEQKVFEVVVWGVPEIRDNVTKVQDLLIDTPAGSVRLGDLAKVRIGSSPVTIARDAVSRYVDVVAQVDGRDAAVVRREGRRALTGLEFPLEYRAELLGEGAGQTAAVQRVLLVGLAAGVGIFLLLQSAFGSARVAAIFVLSLPLALLGAVAVAVATEGSAVSLGSLLGLLAVLGVAVRGGMVMIAHWQHLEREAGQAADGALIMQGGQERVIPILMGAFTLGLAFLAPALSGVVPGYEVLHPMGLVVVGGLATATLMTLFGLPVLYLQFAGQKP